MRERLKFRGHGCHSTEEVVIEKALMVAFIFLDNVRYNFGTIFLGNFQRLISGFIRKLIAMKKVSVWFLESSKSY